MIKKVVSHQTAKKEFVNSIHKWLLRALEANGNGKYKDIFHIEGSSIICDLPVNYFNLFDIPENTKIEMKFIVKKS